MVRKGQFHEWARLTEYSEARMVLVEHRDLYIGRFLKRNPLLAGNCVF
ncbi:hypothetical protein [Exiguobacterium sp. SH4S7]|nr:hypothetical protein [Exiguobacterium sp. SH4S7]